MMKKKKPTRLKRPSRLPDVTGPVLENRYLPLNRVGMAGIETLVRVADPEPKILPAKVDVYVNLKDTQVRGIHMSRIYRILYESLPNLPLNPTLLQKILHDCIKSQKEISSQAQIRVAFVYPLIKPALLSGYEGIRHYPIVWEGELSLTPQKHFVFSHNFELLYSSTCPCSTALSEDLQKKGGDFTGYLATPHAQRSKAEIKVRYHRLPNVGKVNGGFISNSILKLEEAIKTPVQTAVKREDEQEFARLNAENQMFCEDAARILKETLEGDADVSDYRIRVTHMESLHAHDAVAVAVKGVPDGLKA